MNYMAFVSWVYAVTFIALLLYIAWLIVRLSKIEQKVNQKSEDSS